MGFAAWVDPLERCRDGTAEGLELLDSVVDLGEVLAQQLFEEGVDCVAATLVEGPVAADGDPDYERREPGAAAEVKREWRAGERPASTAAVHLRARRAEGPST